RLHRRTHAAERCDRARRRLRWRVAERGARALGCERDRDRPRTRGARRCAPAPARKRARGRLPRDQCRSAGGADARRVRSGRLHGDARARTRSRQRDPRLRDAAQARRQAVALHAQSHAGRVRRSDPRCRARAAAAAARHPSLRAVPQAQRDRQRTAGGGTGIAGPLGHRLQPVHARCAADPERRGELPRLRVETRMKPAAVPRAVLFDLDGTLVDSAPDLVAAVEALCVELGAPVPDGAAVRMVVSAGGRAMLRTGLPGADDVMIDQWLPRFLDIYSTAMTVRTRLYDGMAEVLALLEARGVAWGIVTNKPGWLARPMLAQMEFHRGCAALVTGDCLPVRKPDP